MSLLSIAREASRQRGYEYYREGRVTSVREAGEGIFEGQVRGGAEYSVRIDLKHPRRSSCDCPFAAGRSRICKHMIALYFAEFPQEAESWHTEEERKRAEAELQRELEEKREKELQAAILEHLHGMTKKELIGLVLSLLDGIPEWEFEWFVDNYVYGSDDWEDDEDW